MRSWFDQFFSHPLYFMFWLVIGLIVNAHIMSLSESSQRKLAFQNEIASMQLSSIKSAQREIASTEYKTLQNMKERTIQSQLEGKRGSWFLKNRDFGLSIDELNNFHERAERKLPKRFHDNPLFQLFELITSKSANLDFEDQIACDSTRLFYEEKINQNADLKLLAAQRDAQNTNFSHSCVTYSMRQFTVPKLNYGICQSAVGAVAVPGAKPCISPQLVHLTFNSYTDVSECLNLDMKKYMPKIDFESGFFLNAYGDDRHAGVGQLTKPAITEVNNNLDRYLREIEIAAANGKTSCQNLIKYKKYLTTVPTGTEQRCSLIAMPENPLRNMLFMSLFTKINQQYISGVSFQGGVDVKPAGETDLAGAFKNFQIKEKLAKLGLADLNLNQLADIMILLSYNTGSKTAILLLSGYLDQRIQAGLPLSLSDFDFSKETLIRDLDGKERSEVDAARLYVLSSYISTKDTEPDKALKLMRRKEFPRIWATAFQKSFPIYLTLRANGYGGSSLEPFPIYGYPGYLSVLYRRNQDIRELFANSDFEPDMCTHQDFLKVESKYAQPQ